MDLSSCSSRLSLTIFVHFGQTLCYNTMLAILQAPPCVPNVLVMHSGFSTAFGKDRAAATMWMCGNPRLRRVYPDGPRSFTANFISLPGVKRPLTALENHFPFFAACSVVSPPLASPLRGLLVWPQTDVWPVFWVSTRTQASLDSPCFGSI